MLTEKEKLLISELKSKGLSSRKISTILWGTPSKKSTVNDYLSREPLKDQKKAKILVFDIETSPNIGYFWRRFKENISESQVIQNSYMLTWSAKWLGEDQCIGRSIHEFDVDPTKPNDKELVDELADLIDQADVVVAHNGDRFDLATLNSRLIAHGHQPLDPHKSVDTLKIAKSIFRFPSNSLNSLAIYLGIEIEKIKVDFSLWSRCMENDISAFEEMLEYNIMDVFVLEQVYLKLRPFDKKHPNVALYSDIEAKACPKCGSLHIEAQYKEDGSPKIVTTGVSQFLMYRCQSCGGTSRGRTNLIDKDKRPNILMNAR